MIQQFQVTTGAKLEPVTFTLSVASGPLQEVASARVRLSRDNTGVHDSESPADLTITEGPGSTLLIVWNMSEADTATLPTGLLDGELRLIDPAGNDWVPSLGGRFKLLVHQSPSAPA